MKQYERTGETLDVLRSAAISLYGRVLKAIPIIKSCPRYLIDDLALSQIFLIRSGAVQLEDLPEEDREDIFGSVYGMWRWASYGTPVFILTESAAARFMLTDLRGLSVPDACLPFRAFSIELPSDILSFTNMVGERVEAKRIFTFLAKRPRTCDDALKARAIGSLRLPKEELPPGPYQTDEHFYIVLQGNGISCWSHFIFSDDESLEMAIQKSTSFPIGKTTSISGPLNRQDDEALQAGCRIVFNACLYAAHVRSDRIRQLRHKLTKKTGSLGLPDVATWILGRSISIDPESLEAARTTARPGRSGWRVRSKFIVRGHWRNQSFGPRHASRRMTWIQPFWKGPKDTSIAVMRMYSEDAKKRPES